MNYELRIKNYGRIFATISIVALLLFIIHNSLFIIPARGQQTSDFMVTWKANSYAPLDYQSKILPTTGTVVELSFELIDGGKLANLSQNEIRWYVGNKLQRSGVGLKNFSFTTSASPGNDQSARIVIPNYRGSTLEKTISIPLVSPEVVIVEAGPNTFKAVPYFFNITNPKRLIFRWSANNIEPDRVSEILEENPEVLNLDIQGGRIGDKINIKVSVSNALNELEFASQSINFSIK